MRRILLVAGLLFCASVGFGQTVLAVVTGTITDSTGAVIANAPVSLKNLENGQVFTAATSTTGNFTVSQVPIGEYDLTVASSGFKTYTHSKFHLAAAQVMREDIVLQVGQTSDSVTVTAEASLLKTENSEVSQNVTLSQLNNLPILIVGRLARASVIPSKQCGWCLESDITLVQTSAPAAPPPLEPRWWLTERRPTRTGRVWTA